MALLAHTLAELIERLVVEFYAPARHVRTLVTALAAAAHTDGKSEGLAIASVLASVLAIELGMEREAATILAGTALTSPSVYDYSNQYPSGRAVKVTVLAAGEPPWVGSAPP